MRRRRGKKCATSARKPSLSFVESPLNAQRSPQSLVHCTGCPITADTVSVQEIATSWISPQFGGQLQNGKTAERRIRRLASGRKLEVTSLESAKGGCKSFESNSKTHPKRRPPFKPLLFVLNSSSDEKTKSSDDETSLAAESLHPNITDIHHVVRKKTDLRKEKVDACENSFSDTLLTGAPLKVTTPEGFGEQERNILSEKARRETLISVAGLSSAKKNNCSPRRLFGHIEIHPNRGIEVPSTDRHPSSSAESIPKEKELCHMSFDSHKDSTFNGCLPRMNPLNDSLLLVDETTLVLDDSGKTDDINNDRLCGLPKTSSNVRLGSAFVDGQSTKPCQILSTLALETPSPPTAKTLMVLATDTPFPYYGLTYRQKQLNGYL